MDVSNWLLHILNTMWCMTCPYKHDDNCRTTECFRDRMTVLECIKKQIPKKPNIVINKIKYYNCGSRGSNVRFEDEYRYLHYCGICGQAIDWSEVEE